MEKILVILIAAHSVADFCLQPGWMVQRKKEFPVLLLHGAIHAAAGYLALQAWPCWQVPLFLFASHFVIDGIKQRFRKNTASLFILDQVAHVAALFLLAELLHASGKLTRFDGDGYSLIVLAGGFAAIVFGAGFLIGRFAKRLVEESGLVLEGLPNGGQLIGQLERALIFLFIFTGQPAGIGFLVAAKSILRFEEAKKQKLAEYVLIGTLLSFSLAIALASATQWALSLEHGSPGHHEIHSPISTLP